MSGLTLLEGGQCKLFLSSYASGSTHAGFLNVIRLDHIIKIVREGQSHRAPIERVADLITGYFVPVVTLLAVGTWVTWLALGVSGSLPMSYLDIATGGWGKYDPLHCRLLS